MQHGHLHAAFPQPRRGLQPQQPAADHHRLAAPAGGGDHGIGIVEIAVGDDARQVPALHRQDEGRRAGGDQQLVIGHLAMLALHHFALAVDAGDMLA